MECLTIGSSEDLTSIKEEIIKNMPSNSIRSISFSSAPKESQTGMHFLNICFAERQPSKETALPGEFDLMMAQWIRQKYESQILRQIIVSHYGYFSKQEQARIFRIVSDQRRKATRSAEELHLIRLRLSEYLKTSDKLYLDGFVRFRLREYRANLENAVEEGVDEFLLQREYDEFIELLKFFVEIQTPQIEFLHIITLQGGVYQFLDGDGHDITQDCIEEFMADLLSEEITYGDMLISVMIILAPLQILWHCTELEQNKELIQTAKTIFGERLALCPGCAICENKEI